MPDDYGLGNPTSYYGPSVRQVISVGASPFFYSPPVEGVVAVVGGSVSALAYIDAAGNSVAISGTVGVFHLSVQQQLKVTYTSAPTMTYIQD
jgi:hypothetical protein